MLFKSLDRTEVRNNENGSTLIFPLLNNPQLLIHPLTRQIILTIQEEILKEGGQKVWAFVS